MNLGIDVGGTKIAAGLVRNGKVLKKVVVLTGASKGKKHVLGQIRSVLDELDSPKVKKIGIGVPSVIHGTKLIRARNIPCLNGVDLKKALKIRKPLRVENDVRCFALAEHKYGVGKGTKYFVVCVPGTGLGNAVIIDGKLYHGRSGLISQVSGAIVNPIDVAKGKRIVTEEELVTGPGIMDRHRKRGGKEIWPIDVWESSSRAAKVTLKETAQFLGMRLARIVVTYDPEVIALGGGVMSPKLLSEAKKYAKKYSKYKLPLIKMGTCKDEGIVGAALL